MNQIILFLISFSLGMFYGGLIVSISWNRHNKWLLKYIKALLDDSHYQNLINDLNRIDLSPVDKVARAKMILRGELE